MLFKRLTFYRITQELPHPHTLAQQLAQLPFSPCLSLDWFSEGFAPPNEYHPDFVSLAGDSVAMRLNREDKVLPPSVITSQLNPRISSIEASEKRSVGKRERQELRDTLIDQLLPQAFTKSSHTYALLDYAHLLILIDASPKTAENLLAKLREALGGLEVIRPQTQQPLTQLMTDWLQHGEAEGNFTLDSDSTLKDSPNNQGGATIKASKQNLSADEITQLVRHGKTATQLGLTWQNQIDFILNQDFTLRRLRYTEDLVSCTEPQGDNFNRHHFLQLLMAIHLPKLINELVTLAGGWSDSNG